MPTLWLFDIEPHPQRYTAEWQQHLPQQLQSAMARASKPWKLQVVHGVSTSGGTSPGGFFDFAETNIYKAEQVARFAQSVKQAKVKKGDRVLFTDAWHPGVIHARYMSDLLQLGLSIDVMWHAGSYDWFDLLGQRVKKKLWSYNFERSLFEAADRNLFATQFHWKLFQRVIKPRSKASARVVGWPMEYLGPMLSGSAKSHPKDTILFPHRMSKEKQPDVLKQLQPHLSGIRVVFAQAQVLTKPQYHQELARAVAIFSANKQETLGIGVFEGLLCGAVPIVPNRLSYPEMYPGWCYPSSWTMDLQATQKHAGKLAGHILQTMQQRNPAALAKLAKKVGHRFFNGDKLYACVLR